MFKTSLNDHNDSTPTLKLKAMETEAFFVWSEEGYKPNDHQSKVDILLEFKMLLQQFYCLPIHHLRFVVLQLL